jgi:hypothetical protein
MGGYAAILSHAKRSNAEPHQIQQPSLLCKQSALGDAACHRRRLGLRDLVRRISFCLVRSCERDLLRRRGRAGLPRPLPRDLHVFDAFRSICGHQKADHEQCRAQLCHMRVNTQQAAQVRLIECAHLLRSRVDLLRPRSLSRSLSLSPRLLSRSREPSLDASRLRPRREERSLSLLPPLLHRIMAEQ